MSLWHMRELAVLVGTLGNLCTSPVARVSGARALALRSCAARAELQGARDWCRDSLCVGVATPAAQAAPPQRIKIASFNIQVFGTDKAANDAVMTMLSRIARQFHVLAVQEFRDGTGQVPQLFLDRINRDARVPYAMVAGPRLGRSDSKEQYVIYYRADVVAFVDSFTVPNRGRFERPPLVARFVAGQFDFALVVVHIKPDDAAREMAALARLAETLVDANERDVILLGDFNADCAYFSERDDRHPLRAPGFHWVIGNEARTAVRSACTYDRIVLLDGTFGYEYVPNSARVFRYDSAFGLKRAAQVRAVSDHFPVFAEFTITGPDDDGR